METCPPQLSFIQRTNFQKWACVYCDGTKFQICINPGLPKKQRELLRGANCSGESYLF